jgi:hypothetical protein
MAPWLGWLTGLPMVHLEELRALSTEHGFPHYLAWALAHRGRRLAANREAQKGLELLTQALLQYRSVGSAICLPMLLIWLAEAHAKLGQFAEGQASLAEAAELIEATDERLTHQPVI